MDTRRDLLIIGGGEHSRVVIESARSRPDLWSVIGFADHQPSPATTARLNVPWLGTDEECIKWSNAVWHILGIGGADTKSLREDIVERYSRVDARWATVVHATAWVSNTAVMGDGVFASAGAVINSGARIGNHCVINTGAVLEHDVEIEPFVQVGPGAIVGGGTIIGMGSFVGLGCRIRDHVRIGRRVVVGMGAVVVASISDQQTVIGVPARATRRDK